tara:strand:+ start:1066 stop:2622 length:1557 start_codon:yes stop_codon:yes gene_type:complete
MNMADQQDYLLSIDNGTQSIRAIVFDKTGREIAKSAVPITPYYSKENGWAEQEPSYFWEYVCKATNELWKVIDFPKSHIKAVSMTTQRATVVCLDNQNKPLRSAISWLDSRKVDTKPKLNLIEAALLKVLGAKKFVDMFHQNAEANWISQNQSDLWKSVKKFILLSCYQNFKLTGLFKDSVASTVGYLPFDFRKQEWADKKSFQWKIMPINQDMLPELVEAGEKIGVVSNKASLETGIPEGTPVIASGSDKACEVLGTGCIDEKMANFSYGSLATVNVSSNKYQEALRFHPAYPGVIPGTYNIEMMLQRGFWMISWFKREFGDIERQLAKTKNTSPETLLNQLLESVPAGSDGLMLQPYWSPSNGDGDETRGAIIGFNELHTRAHIYRAMIEGIVYAMRECKEIIEKRTGNKFAKIVISGGGSQSNEIMQISADILGTPVYRSSIFEASSLGAAIASAVGIGIYPNFKVAVSKMVRVGQIFEPNDSNKKLYDQLYNTVFKGMYSSLRPAYLQIKDIFR